MPFFRRSTRTIAGLSSDPPRRLVPRDKIFSGLTYKTDSGKTMIVMGYIDWPGIGREYTIVSENGDELHNYGAIFEDQVICA